MSGRDRSYDPTAATHRALREIRQELERHPVVDAARGFPSSEHTRVVAQLRPSAATGSRSDATLTVRWFAGETPDARPEFSFHYSDDSGVDFGWHHEPNTHVDGWGHFQERAGPDEAYEYESYTFDSITPTRVVWEIMSLVASQLES